MSGITSTGFAIKTEGEIVSDLESKGRELFGNEVDLTPQSPLGMLVQLVAYSQYLQWEGLEGSYYSIFLDTAEGLSLDRVAGQIGLTRKPATNEVVSLNFTGTNYTVIPAGFVVSSPSGIEYNVDNEVVIQSGVATATATATAFGVVNRVNENQLTDIVTPLAGVDTVTNPDKSSGGRSLETDQELRDRAFSSLQGSKSQSVIGYIITKIKNDPNVNSAIVIQNPYSRTSDDGTMPPNSIHFVIEGGTTEYISSLVNDYTLPGIEMVGGITQTVRTEYGDTEIKFSRPGEYNVWVRIDIVSDGDFDVSNIRDITAQTIKYVGGIDSYTVEGEPKADEYTGLDIGQNVIAWKLYSIVGEYTGIESLNILLGSSAGTITQSIIQVPADKRARTITARVAVNVS